MTDLSSVKRHSLSFLIITRIMDVRNLFYLVRLYSNFAENLQLEELAWFSWAQ